MSVNRQGKVTRLYPNIEGCYIRIPGSGGGPKHDYFQLKKSHENYNSLYSLAVVAAVNRYNLNIRTKNEIQVDVIAEVAYLSVDWPE